MGRLQIWKPLSAVHGLWFSRQKRWMAVASVGTDSDVSEFACKGCANNLDNFSRYVHWICSGLEPTAYHRVQEILSEMVVVTWIVMWQKPTALTPQCYQVPFSPKSGTGYKAIATEPLPAASYLFLTAHLTLWLLAAATAQWTECLLVHPVESLAHCFYLRVYTLIWWREVVMAWY